MSRKVPFECTTSPIEDNLHITAIAPECQKNRLCSKETSGVDIEAEIIASINGTKVYGHIAQRDEKGHVTRRVKNNKEEKSAEQEIEK